jgi:hypothetical protein
MRYSLMIQLVATITLIFLGTAAMFAWLQYRPGLEEKRTQSILPIASDRLFTAIDN